MADNLTNDAENAVLDHIHGVADYVIVLPLKLALLTSTPSDSSLASEPSGGSYARQTITMGAAAAGIAANTNVITFAGMPACVVAGFAIYDSSGTPKRIWHGGANTSRTLGSGDTYQVPVGGLTVSLS